MALAPRVWLLGVSAGLLWRLAAGHGASDPSGAQGSGLEPPWIGLVYSESPWEFGGRVRGLELFACWATCEVGCGTLVLISTKAVLELAGAQFSISSLFSVSKSTGPLTEKLVPW